MESRFLVLLLSGFLVVSLSACGGRRNLQADEGPQQVPVIEPEVERRVIQNSGQSLIHQCQWDGNKWAALLTYIT